MVQPNGKSAMVTGAYGAIGKAISQLLAEQGYHMVLVGRDESRLQKAVQEIIRQTGNQQVDFETVDLSRKSEIDSLASRWKGPLNVLINNAVWSPRKRTETPEGIEAQFATNVLGYYRMIRGFTEFMKEPDDARIINVASYWAGELELNDPEFKKRTYDNNTAYRQSKQADRMLVYAFAEMLKSFGITINSCHPGDVNSKVSNDLGFGGFETPDQGAATPVWLATAPEVRGITGNYFSYCEEAYCEFAGDKKAIERLFRICEEYR